LELPAHIAPSKVIAISTPIAVFLAPSLPWARDGLYREIPADAHQDRDPAGFG